MWEGEEQCFVLRRFPYATCLPYCCCHIQSGGSASPISVSSPRERSASDRESATSSSAGTSELKRVGFSNGTKAGLAQSSGADSRSLLWFLKPSAAGGGAGCAGGEEAQARRGPRQASGLCLRSEGGRDHVPSPLPPSPPPRCCCCCSTSPFNFFESSPGQAEREAEEKALQEKEAKMREEAESESGC